MVEKVLRCIVLGGIFLLPLVALVLADGLFFPYITGKSFAFRVIVEIITGAWLALALVIPSYRPRRSWILAAFALFVFVIALADAQGAYPFKSFWSNFERMDGWVTIAHLLCYLAVLVCVMQTENLWRRLFQWSLGVSVFLSFLGFLQVAGILTLGSGGTGLEGRVDATFGNPIYLAVYMLFHVFIAALLWYQMWQVRGKGNRVPASIFYGVAILLDTGALLFTGTRGTMLGLIGGVLLALVMFALSSDASKRFRQITAGVFALGLVLGGTLWVSRDTSFVRQVGFLSRLATISLTDNTTHARLLNMGIAWQGVKERPLLGWGQENYAIVFDKYYDPQMYAQEQWFDRVHNIIFDWLIAGGFLGLLAYLSIFAATLWALWRAGSFTVGERSILTGLLAGYFIHNMTVFDNVTSYILFATVLGYIAYRENAAQNARLLFEREILPRSMLALTGALAAVLVWGVAWEVNAKPLMANQAIIVGMTPHSDLQVNLSAFEQAIALGTYGTQEARETLWRITVEQILPAAGVSNDLKLQFVQTAVHELDLQAKESPLDARFPLFAGQILDVANRYKDAQVELARAHDLSPDKQTILYELAQNASLRGDVPATLQYFKTALDLAPDNTTARIYYASALIQVGRDADADTVLAPIIPTGVAADTHIAAAYAARKEYSKLVPIWQAHIKVDPTDAQAYFTLAAAYFAAGDSAHAISTLQQAGTISAAIKAQADTFIQQIKSGTLTPGR